MSRNPQFRVPQPTHSRSIKDYNRSNETLHRGDKPGVMSLGFERMSQQRILKMDPKETRRAQVTEWNLPPMGTLTMPGKL